MWQQHWQRNTNYLNCAGRAGTLDEGDEDKTLTWPLAPALLGRNCKLGIEVIA